MGALTLSDVFNAKDDPRYLRGDFTQVKADGTAYRLGMRVAEAMRRNQQPSGGSLIRSITLSLQPKARGDFLKAVGDAFTRIGKLYRETATVIAYDVYDHDLGARFFVPHATKKKLWLVELPVVYTVDTEYPPIFMQWSKDEPVDCFIVLPLEMYKTYDAHTVTYSFDVFTENSKAAGSETSVEVYMAVEGGASMPIPVASFSFKGGVKIAEKTYSRNEQRTARRSGIRVSKNYKVEKIRQSVMTFGTGQIATEEGIVIHRNEVGDIVGPFWPAYSFGGAADTGNARKRADNAIKYLLESASTELAKDYAPAQ